MARLQAPPQRRGTLTQETTPPPTILSDASNDTEAATQQLLDEVAASASKSASHPQHPQHPQHSATSPKSPHPPQSAQPPPPQSSAVLGANLLNAARVEYRHSSPIRMAPKSSKSSKSSNGKLRSSGLFTEPRRFNLARPRPRDVYEFPDESPERRPYKLHERVNRAPLKILKKKKAPQEDVPFSSESVQALAEEDASEGSGFTNEAPLPSSPPRLAPNPSHAVENGVQIETRLRNGAVRCAVTSYRSGKPVGPRYEQCHKPGSHETNAGPRCTRHLSNPGSVRCGFMLVHNGNPVQCRTAGVKGTARCSKHAGQEAACGLGPVHKRKSSDNDDVPAKPSKSAKVQPQATAGRRAQKEAEEAVVVESQPLSDPEVQLPSRTKKRGRPASTIRSEGSGEEDEVAESIEPTASPTSKGHRRTRSKAHPLKETISAAGSKKSKNAPKVTKATRTTQAKDDQPSDDNPESDAEIQKEPASSEEAASDDEEEAGEPSETSQALRRVFKYLEDEKRPGRCQTDVCLTIKRVCDEARGRLRGHDLEIEQMAAIGGKVQAALNELRNVDSDDRLAIKADMYGHVFRSLTKLAKSLYGSWDAGADTLEVMRILVPLVHHILVMKDMMASWKVTVPQRYDGDRMVGDVNSHLIAPLRKAHDVLSKRLRQLEGRQCAARDLANIERQIGEENEEMERLKSTAAAQRDRWARWQQLHIARMRCEPDPRKRLPNLKIINLEDLEDTDANGIKFQRLPVFKDRETPPRRHPSRANRLKSWSPEQEQALLDGLQRFAGRDVFYKIFEAYCRPRTGGVLRDFRVLDIVTKAAEFRSTLPAAYQENDWDMPEWVRQIPVLP
ncbi:hypothetical protein HBI25_189090 [Parastagonospora nodorum]|nr:hypothetical protein HBH53_242170 [Parastagonospora nodorum]KAH3964669.1 hypothetical protein HBH51_159520 [Parastagonospora nodorum]KAH4159940.1 hypothetical protein HBH43_186400 [Parastagonospora nodorum]KAH4187977.1 hypothetical protein HBH42_152800 [Parastagonospora nodorum]KAH4226906.1 hypothetical protein HBI06_105760 [Parastagonospora nodorum]